MASAKVGYFAFVLLNNFELNIWNALCYPEEIFWPIANIS